MKGIVYTKDGPSTVLQLMEVKKSMPKVHQALIKVKASSINVLESAKFLKLQFLEQQP
jgi:NADPH:quinone reductase-like Zn-dependent oxidoreductase